MAGRVKHRYHARMLDLQAKLTTCRLSTMLMGILWQPAVAVLWHSICSQQLMQAAAAVT